MADRNLELALRVKADMAQARKALDELESTLRGTSGAAKSAGTSAKSAGRGMDSMGGAANNATTKARKLNRTLDKTRSVGQSVNRAFHDLRNILVGAFVVHELARFVGSLAHANVEAQRIHFTLQQVFGADAAEQYDYVRKEAERLGLSLADTAEGYAQLAAAAQGTGTSTKALQSVFTGMNEAATVLHASTADVAGVFTQLAQGISLGKLQMQDIRAISQHLPGTMSVLQKAAKRLGTTLEYSLAHGGLDAKKMLEAIGEVLHERFGAQAKAAAHSLNSELNRLKSTLFEIQTEDNSFEGKFANAVRDLNATLSDPGFKQGLENLIDALGTIIESSVKAAAKLGDLLAGLKGYAEYAAAMQHGAGGFDLGGLSVERGKITAELKQRAAHPILSAINTFLAGTENNPVQNALEGGRPRIQSMSTQQLQQRLNTIDTQIARLKELRADQRERDANNLTASISSAAGDFIDSILAPSKKPTPRSDDSDNDAARKKAAALTKAAAQDNQQLRDTFIQLQAAQDPTAAAWARYNEVVGKANQRVTEAKTKLDALVAAGKLSRAEADRRLASSKGLAAGIEVLARDVRDAKIDEIAKKGQEAWEKFRQSLEAPLEARVSGAIADIDMLNKHMSAAGDTAGKYQGLMNAIFAKALGDNGLRRVHTPGPAGGILDTQSQEQADYHRQMDLIARIRDQVLADQKASYDERLAAQRAYQRESDRLTQLHAQNQQALEMQKMRFSLQTAQAGFGALAQAASQAYGEQSKQARAAFALQKAAAVASAALAIQQSIANSAKMGYPWNIISIAGAIAQGVALLASVNSVQPGYADGGYTGPGAKHQAAGIVHAGEVVWSQDDIRRAGGVGIVETMRLRGYADGGYVNPLANAPSPAQLGITAPSMPRMRLADFASRAGSSDNQGNGAQTHIHVWSMEQAAEELAKIPSFSKAVVHIVGDNPRSIRGKWGS